MQIAFFSDSYTPYVSGVVRSIQRFAKGLTERGHSLYIFAPSYAQAPQPTVWLKGTKEYRFWSLPAPHAPSFYLPIPVSPYADRLIQQLSIDIIHCHSPFLMGQLGLLLAKRHRIPLVFTHHTLYHEYCHYLPAPPAMARRVIIRFLKRFCRRCTHVLTPTEDIGRLLQELYQLQTPITVLPSGIDLAPYHQAERQFLQNHWAIPRQAKILLFVGRLSKEKNIDVVWDTFQLLAPHHPHLHLVLVGDGPERSRLEAQVTTSGMAHRVHFTGILDAEQVIGVYCSADMLLFPSVTETQGLVTVEAMAAGLPVIGAEAPGTRDIVKHGISGYLSIPQAEPLARCVHTLLTDPAAYSRMRIQALKTAQDYSITQTTGRLLSVYETIRTPETSRTLYDKAF